MYSYVVRARAVKKSEVFICHNGKLICLKLLNEELAKLVFYWRDVELNTKKLKELQVVVSGK